MPRFDPEIFDTDNFDPDILDPDIFDPKYLDPHPKWVYRLIQSGIIVKIDTQGRVLFFSPKIVPINLAKNRIKSRDQP